MRQFIKFFLPLLAQYVCLFASSESLQKMDYSRTFINFVKTYEKASLDYKRYGPLRFTKHFNLNSSDESYLMNNLGVDTQLPYLNWKKKDNTYSLSFSESKNKNFTLEYTQPEFKFEKITLNEKNFVNLEKTTLEILNILKKNQISFFENLINQSFPMAHAANNPKKVAIVAFVAALAIISINRKVTPRLSDGDPAPSLPKNTHGFALETPPLPAFNEEEDSLREKIIDEAKKHFNKQYVWDTAGPNTFDCSGFVHFVMTQTRPEKFQLPYDLKRINEQGSKKYQHQSDFYRDQLGKAISCEEAKTADLVFFPSETGKSKYNHIGFISDPSNKKFISAESGGVREDDYSKKSHWGQFQATCYKNPWI